MCLTIEGIVKGYGGRKKNVALGASHWGNEGEDL